MANKLNEIKELNGIVQDKTENSIKIQNFWIRYFDEEILKDLENYELGDEILLTYKDHKKVGSNKVYHNGVSLKLCETKRAYVEDDVCAEEQVKESIKPKYVSDTTINTLIMTTKELYLSPLNKNNLSIETIAGEVMKAYNKIIENL